MFSYTDIRCFTVSGGRNPNHLISIASALSRRNGSYAGFQTEEPQIEEPLLLFVVNVFESEGAHITFLQSALNDALDAELSRLAEGEVAHRIVLFDDVERRLRASITEFVTFTLKEDNMMNDLGNFTTQLREKLEGSESFYGSSWAPVLNVPNTYHGILGWDTVKAHWDAVRDGPGQEVKDRKEIIDRMLERADICLVHAALQPLAEI